MKISGGRPLQGELMVQGSKNAALPMIAAAVLSEGITVLHNCPQIIDVTHMITILEGIGCRVLRDKNSLVIDAAGVNAWEIPGDLARQMRSSILMSGALLGRMHKAVIPYPGGCVIGERPIDLHLEAFKKMNAVIREDGSGIVAETTELKGAEITFPFPSVGATENVLLAGVLAKGVTVIQNAAREPEIVELGRLLNRMGGSVRGAGTDRIVITGVEKLHGTEMTVVSDRIAAGTYVLAAAGTRGRVALENAPFSHLTALLAVLEEIGGQYMYVDHTLLIDGSCASGPAACIETMPYPGFPTDLQSQLLAVVSCADGVSRICERIFEARFKAAVQLEKMGARLYVDGNEVRVTGVKKLYGASVEAEELRGGAALVIAGLMADGVTTISNAHYIKRGYVDICKDLKVLGASIQDE